ncbi:nitroreductase family protein [Thauera butanivorans]|uniref:nitroreductase family protein n=1 Tax=Thauera butanivorans TaxID=86174 RepID=UPI003AB7C9D9
MSNRETLLEILNLARWAPSGDNTQPWKFEILADDHVAVHGHDTRDWCLYDMDGRASQMAHGALLETLRIAATRFGLRAEWNWRAETPEHAPIYDVKLVPEADLAVDPLHPFITTRTVQRRMMRRTPLAPSAAKALRLAPGDGYSVRLVEPVGERLKIAGLLWTSARVRLTCPEAFEVHREIIEWGATFSKDRIPERAVGVDPLTARLMQWAMKSWARVDALNRYAFGTVAPRVMLDFLPAWACAAHVLVERDVFPASLPEFVDAGRAMQRVWLTAAAQGLHLQPQMTPLIFGWYAQAEQPVSADEHVNAAMHEVGTQVDRMLGNKGVFFCRVGESAVPVSRSIRKELAELMV